MIRIESILEGRSQSIVHEVFIPALQRMWSPAYLCTMQGTELNTRGPDGRLSLYIAKWSATVGLLRGESVRSSGCDLLRKES